MRTVLAVGYLMLRVIGYACLIVGLGVMLMFAAVFMAMARSSANT